MPPRRNGWFEADRNYPCPICGGKDWCGYNERGVVCMRHDIGKPTANGGWFSTWSQLQAVPPIRVTPVSEPQELPSQVCLATPARLNQVYSSWLKLLPWNHQEHMLSRGISLEDQARHGYRSYELDPMSTYELVQRLVEMVGSPEGIPGFYPAKKGWMFAAHKGIVIPVRDRTQRIVALKIRRMDQDEPKKRYRLVSSARRRGGASPGSPVHWAVPEKIVKPSVIGITEGDIKANYMADRLGIICVSVPGVSNWRYVLPLSSPNALLCFDIESREKVRKIVERHKKMLTEELHKSRVKVWYGEWNPQYKGVDDALAAGEKIHLLKVIKN